MRYCEDLRREVAERLADDLRRDGQYELVRVRPERPERGYAFASVWVYGRRNSGGVS